MNVLQAREMLVRAIVIKVLEVVDLGQEACDETLRPRDDPRSGLGIAAMEISREETAATRLATDDPACATCDSDVASG
jgi:hypothetical protein